MRSHFRVGSLGVALIAMTITGCGNQSPPTIQYDDQAILGYVKPITEGFLDAIKTNGKV